MSKASKGSAGPRDIAVNRKARHDYHLEEKFEAGLVLEGWEVKSLRAGKCNLTEAYIMLKDGEAWLFGCRIEALGTASTHINPDPVRNRKLLLHRRELGRLFAGVQREGFTCVPLSLYWDRGRAKLEVALAKGKQKFDKRATEKDRDWKRQKQRVMRRK
jgi:SsrA-binding protein